VRSSPNTNLPRALFAWMMRMNFLQSEVTNQTLLLPTNPKCPCIEIRLAILVSGRDGGQKYSNVLKHCGFSLLTLGQTLREHTTWCFYVPWPSLSVRNIDKENTKTAWKIRSYINKQKTPIEHFALYLDGFKSCHESPTVNSELMPSLIVLDIYNDCTQQELLLKICCRYRGAYRFVNPFFFFLIT